MSWKKSDYKILKIIKIHLKVNKKTCIDDKRLLLQDLSFHFFFQLNYVKPLVYPCGLLKKIFLLFITGHVSDLMYSQMTILILH